MKRLIDKIRLGWAKYGPILLKLHENYAYQYPTVCQTHQMDGTKHDHSFAISSLNMGHMYAYMEIL